MLWSGLCVYNLVDGWVGKCSEILAAWATLKSEGNKRYDDEDNYVYCCIVTNIHT